MEILPKLRGADDKGRITMPTENTNECGVWLVGEDGILRPWNSIPELTITDDDTLPLNTMYVTYTDMWKHEFSFELRVSSHVLARLNRQMYRWKAKGPLRHRVIRRLLERMARA